MNLNGSSQLLDFNLKGELSGPHNQALWARILHELRETNSHAQATLQVDTVKEVLSKRLQNCFQESTDALHVCFFFKMDLFLHLGWYLAQMVNNMGTLANLQQTVIHFNILPIRSSKSSIDLLYLMITAVLAEQIAHSETVDAATNLGIIHAICSDPIDMHTFSQLRQLAAFFTHGFEYVKGNKDLMDARSARKNLDCIVQTFDGSGANSELHKMLNSRAQDKTDVLFHSLQIAMSTFKEENMSTIRLEQMRTVLSSRPESTAIVALLCVMLRVSGVPLVNQAKYKQFMTLSLFLCARTNKVSCLWVFIFQTGVV